MTFSVTLATTSLPFDYAQGRPRDWAWNRRWPCHSSQGRGPGADRRSHQRARATDNGAVQIRPEAIADVGRIADVHRRAFSGSVEAMLVDALRQQARPLVSLVAVDEDVVAGHILFSPVTLSARPELPLMGLAPMAVLPSHQRQGVGSALVRVGLEECRRLGRVACVVLGHPAFYSRFGFSPASGFGLTSEYDVADEVFMAIELQAGALRGQAGTIQYHPAFAALS
jgi:putative acetyltransferase